MAARLKQWAKGLAVLLLALALVGGVTETVVAQLAGRQHPAPGRLVDLGGRYRTCAYDLAGLGWSDPARGTRDGAAVAADLHALLQAAG